MTQVLDAYLIDHQYEQVRRFNDEPNTFDYEQYTKDSIATFRNKQKKIREEAEENKTADEKPPLFLGLQEHNKSSSLGLPIA